MWNAPRSWVEGDLSSRFLLERLRHCVLSCPYGFLGREGRTKAKLGGQLEVGKGGVLLRGSGPWEVHLICLWRANGSGLSQLCFFLVKIALGEVKIREVVGEPPEA